MRSHYADRLHLEFKAVLPEVRSVVIETRAPSKVARLTSVETFDATPAPRAVAAAPMQPVEADEQPSLFGGPAPTPALRRVRRAPRRRLLPRWWPLRRPHCVFPPTGRRSTRA
ncbi:hypothetical protein GCM10020258_30050 [Sphingomonas yabuuchiae]